MKGHIELIEKKEKVTRVKIDKVFYSYFGADELKDGDTVEFEFEERGKYKTITKLVKIVPELTFKDKSIIRQTALKCACMTYHINAEGSIQQQVPVILKLADTFEEYLCKTK